MALSWGDLMALAGILIGGGGLAALWRTRNQNRVDDRRQLTEEQAAFRRDMAEQLAALRTQVAELSRRNDVLEDDAKKQAVLTARLEQTNETQAGQLLRQAEQIRELEKTNTTLETRLLELVDEKAALISRVTALQLTKDVLERENNDLRREVATLRGRLDGVV